MQLDWLSKTIELKELATNEGGGSWERLWEAEEEGDMAWRKASSASAGVRGRAGGDTSTL